MPHVEKKICMLTKKNLLYIIISFKIKYLKKIFWADPELRRLNTQSLGSIISCMFPFCKVLERRRNRYVMRKRSRDSQINSLISCPNCP